MSKVSDNVECRLIIETINIIKSEDKTALDNKIKELNNLIDKEKLSTNFPMELAKTLWEAFLANPFLLTLMQQLNGIPEQKRLDYMWRYKIYSVDNRDESSIRNLIKEFITEFQDGIIVSKDVTQDIIKRCLKIQDFELMETIYSLLTN